MEDLEYRVIIADNGKIIAGFAILCDAFVFKNLCLKNDFYQKELKVVDSENRVYFETETGFIIVK